MRLAEERRSEMGEEEGRGHKARVRLPRQRRRVGERKQERWHNGCIPVLVMVLGKKKLSARGRIFPELLRW